MCVCVCRFHERVLVRIIRCRILVVVVRLILVSGGLFFVWWWWLPGGMGGVVLGWVKRGRLLLLLAYSLRKRRATEQRDRLALEV